MREYGALHGLKIAAVAVVAQAVWGMARALCPDARSASPAVFSVLLVLVWHTALGQIAAILICGVIDKHASSRINPSGVGRWRQTRRVDTGRHERWVVPYKFKDPARVEVLGSRAIVKCVVAQDESAIATSGCSFDWTASGS